MSEEIDEKIEEVIERKVEEKLEKQTRDEIEDSVIDQKIEEKIAEKVANRDKREKQNFVEKTQNEGISRRKFLKMLGVGVGGLALSSSAAGLSWSKITPQSQGTSDIKSSTVEDGAITSAKLSNSSVIQSKLGFDFDESAQDAVGSALTSDFNYDDTNNQIDLSFDPSTHATSTELSNHVGDTTNPHNVTDEQTGGAARSLIYDKSVLSEGPVIGSVPDGSVTFSQDTVKSVNLLDSDLSAVSYLWLSLEADATQDTGGTLSVEVRILVDGSVVEQKTIFPDDGWVSLATTYGVQDLGSATVTVEFDSQDGITTDYRNATVSREKQVVDV